MKSTGTVLVAAALAACLCETGCSSRTAASAGADAGSNASTGSKVAKIVFIDQKECCDCTRRRIDGSWAALGAALQGRTPAIPIERIHRDSQADAEDQWRMLRPYVTVPAIYFVDTVGGIVELLQGEITAEQCKKILK